MYLMIVSRENGEFSIIPLLQAQDGFIRNQWSQVMKDPGLVSEIERYRNRESGMLVTLSL